MTATLPSQLSVAVAVPKSGVAGQLSGLVTVGQVILGGTRSCTAMVRLQVAVLPQSSVAVQVRVMLATPVQLADVASLYVMDTLASQASDAVASPNVGVAGQLTGLTTVGQVMLGGVTSCTATVLLQVAVLPQSSVAIQVRVTLGIPVQLADVTSLNVIDTLASHASVAVASPKLGEAGPVSGGTTVWLGRRGTSKAS